MMDNSGFELSRAAAVVRFIAQAKPQLVFYLEGRSRPIHAACTS
jgi:hypothetical protein